MWETGRFFEFARSTQVVSATAAVALAASALSILALSSCPARADDAFIRPGAYLGLGGSYALDHSTISNLTENSLGLSARLGYRFSPNIALEGHFEWIDGLDVSAPGVRGRVEPWVLTANARGLLMTGRIQPFGLVGMGLMRVKFVDELGTLSSLEPASSGTASGFAMRFGAGIDFHITRHVVVSLEASYVLPAGSVQDRDITSTGFAARYHF